MTKSGSGGERQSASNIGINEKKKNGEMT